MSDSISPEHRSWNMSRIRSKDTKIEVMVRKYLFSKGYRFRKNDKRYPGKPDVVLPKYHTAIFVNGCFWHQHEGCKNATIPKSRSLFNQFYILLNQTQYVKAGGKRKACILGSQS